MSRKLSKYPQVISTSISLELYEYLQQEAARLGTTVAALVRTAMVEAYRHEVSQMFTIMASEEEVTQLRGLGYRIAEQE